MYFYPKPKECLFAHIDIATGEVSWYAKEFCTGVLVQTNIVVTPEQVVKLNEGKPVIEHDGWQSARTYEYREKILETAVASSVTAALGDKHVDVNGFDVNGTAELSKYVERLNPSRSREMNNTSTPALQTASEIVQELHNCAADGLSDLSPQQQTEAMKAAAAGGTEAFVSTLIFLLPGDLRAAAADAWLACQ